MRKMGRKQAGSPLTKPCCERESYVHGVVAAPFSRASFEEIVLVCTSRRHLVEESAQHGCKSLSRSVDHPPPDRDFYSLMYHVSPKPHQQVHIFVFPP
jgi:hypothetical protein